MKPRFQAVLPHVALLAGLLVVAILFTSRAHTAPVLIAPPGLEKINHFVFIMQENHSFDSYFGTCPAVEGIPPGICLTDPTPGAPCVKLFHDTNNVNRGGPHGLIPMPAGSPYPPTLRSIVHPANTVVTILSAQGGLTVAAESIASAFGSVSRCQ